MIGVRAGRLAVSLTLSRPLDMIFADDDDLPCVTRRLKLAMAGDGQVTLDRWL